MTQKDIEDIMVYAKLKGISVLKIGVPKDILEEYKNKVFGNRSFVLEASVSNSATYQRGEDMDGCVQIVALED